MADITIENNVAPPPEEPKKPRKPRKRKTQVVESKPEKKAKKSLPDAINHVGNTVTCTGVTVKVRKLSPAQLQGFGIKSVEGTLGEFCTTPVKLTFKNEKAALSFFDTCFNAEKKADEYIIDDDADWNSAHLGSLVG